MDRELPEEGPTRGPLSQEYGDKKQEERGVATMIWALIEVAYTLGAGIGAMI